MAMVNRGSYEMRKNVPPQYENGKSANAGRRTRDDAHAALDVARRDLAIRLRSARSGAENPALSRKKSRRADSNRGPLHYE
jgi:hypothetical protein